MIHFYEPELRELSKEDQIYLDSLPPTEVWHKKMLDSIERSRLRWVAKREKKERECKNTP